MNILATISCILSIIIDFTLIIVAIMFVLFLIAWIHYED